MKNIVPKSIFALLLSAIVIVGCQKDDVVLENSSKELIVTLSVPPTTRVQMTENETNNIIVRWKEGDKLDFCFVSSDGNDIRTLKGVPLINLQNEGASAQFALTIPVGLEAPFNLYGVYGASFEEESKLITLPAPPTNELELNDIESTVVLTFSIKEVGGASPPLHSSLQFFGTMVGVWLDNPTSTPIEVTDLEIDGGDYNWIEDISTGAQYDIEEAQFITNEPSSKLTFLQDGAITVGAKENKKLYRWIIPSSSFDPSKELTIKINGVELAESLPAVDFVFGKYYIVKLEYDGTGWERFTVKGAITLPGNTNCHLIEPPANLGEVDRYHMPIYRINEFWGSADGGNTLALKPDTKWVAEIIWKDVDVTTANKAQELITLTKSTGVGPFDLISFDIAYDQNERYGNAVIGVRKAKENFEPEGDYLWSWHIWISDYPSNGQAYDLSDGDGLFTMDRNLGARNNIIAPAPHGGTMGLLYQWGRKDPFVSGTFAYWNMESTAQNRVATTLAAPSFKDRSTSNEIEGGGTVAWAVKNPANYIYTAGSNWLLTSVTTLWSQTEKTIYDPCPVGFKVASGGQSSVTPHSFRSLELGAANGDFVLYPEPTEDDTNKPRGMLYNGEVFFPFTGYLASGSGGLNNTQTRCYVTSSRTGSSGASLYQRVVSFTKTEFVGIGAGINRGSAVGVRCMVWEE